MKVARPKNAWRKSRGKKGWWLMKKLVVGGLSDKNIFSGNPPTTNDQTTNPFA